MPERIGEEKRRLREQQRRRANIWLADPAAQRPYVEALNRQTLDLVLRWTEPGDTVGMFAGVGAEPDLSPAAWQLQTSGRTVCLPKVLSPPKDGARMSFLPITLKRPSFASADLVPGPWGIPEPGQGPAQARIPKVLVVPALGGDARGGRLGHGGGYYDRYLSAPERPEWTLLPLLPWQVCSRIPMDRWDHRMDRVIGYEGQPINESNI